MIKKDKQIIDSTSWAKVLEASRFLSLDTIACIEIKAGIDGNRQEALSVAAEIANKFGVTLNDENLYRSERTPGGWDLVLRRSFPDDATREIILNNLKSALGFELYQRGDDYIALREDGVAHLHPLLRGIMISLVYLPKDQV